jgi:hypothetical protein
MPVAALPYSGWWGEIDTESDLERQNIPQKEDGPY